MKNPSLIRMIKVATASIYIGIAGIALKPYISEMIKEERDSPNLVVNNDNSYRNITYKSKEEAIPDLKRLATESKLEESWAYIPSEKKWIETGFDETNNSVKQSKAHSDIIQWKYKNPIFIHIHPKQEASALSDLALEARIMINLQDANRETPINEIINRAEIILAASRTIPSLSDMQSLLGKQEEIYSSRGVTKFRKNKNFNPKKYENLTDTIRTTILHNIEFSDNEENMKKGMKNIFQLLSLAGAKVEFTPYEELKTTHL